MKCLVEPISILVLNDVLFEEEREGHLCASVNPPVEPEECLLTILIAVFGSVHIQGRK